MKEFIAIPGSAVRAPVYLGPHVARSVSERVLAGRLDIPRVPVPMASEWVTQAAPCLREPGEIVAIKGAATQWQETPQVAALAQAWALEQGLSAPFDRGSGSLLACLGASFHDDSGGFADFAFCVVWLSDDTGLDLYFPHSGKRVPLALGTIVGFDSCQPHGVVERGATTWDGKRHYDREDPTQLFLSWDMCFEDERLRAVMGVAVFDETPVTDGFNGPHINKVAVFVDANTGAWV